MMMLKMMMPVSIFFQHQTILVAKKTVKYFFEQSMPKMPGGDDGEKKEETAESREEAKEQVNIVVYQPFLKTFWLKSYRIRSA